MLKALRCLFRRALKNILRRRLAGLNVARKSITKRADRTELHRSRKLVTPQLGQVRLASVFMCLAVLQSQTESKRRSWSTKGADPCAQYSVPQTMHVA